MSLAPDSWQLSSRPCLNMEQRERRSSTSPDEQRAWTCISVSRGPEQEETDTEMDDYGCKEGEVGTFTL